MQELNEYGKVDILKTVLDLGVNVKELIKDGGPSLLDRLINDSLGSLHHRVAVELLLFENLDIDTHRSAITIGLLRDFSANHYHSIRRAHGRFGHDEDNLALNFLGPLLVECGFIFTRNTCEIPEEKLKELHQVALEYIRRCRDNPRP